MTATAPTAAPRLARTREAVVLLATAAIAAFAAFFAAALGIKGVVAGVAGLGLVTLLVVVRKNRSLVLMFGVVMAFVVLQHKTIGPKVINVESGALGLSISSVDVVIVLLYVFWAMDGTMAQDLRWAMRRAIFWVPLFGLFLMSFSLLVAERPYLSIAEVFRLGWIYLLFLYVGARVRTKKEITVILAGLGLFAMIEFGVVLLQWKTGGVLGLGFLGVPKTLTARTLDVGEIGRPFGTLIHPVFLGCVLACIGLIALSLAINLRERRWRQYSLAVVPLCVLPMALSHTRGPALAFGIAATALVAISLVRHRLTTRALVISLVVVLAVAVVAWPQISTLIHENFGTHHFSTEVHSRTQLNHVGYRMFLSSPLVGTGLNNFTQIMNGFLKEPLLFPGFPSHNLFILQAAETGLLGEVALLAVGASLMAVAWKLSRSKDRLFSAIGTGTFCVYIFYLVEEQLAYSLREEVPLGILWLLAGLTVACLRIDASQRPGARPSARIPDVRGNSPASVNGNANGASRPARAPVSRPRVMAMVATVPMAFGWIAAGASAADSSTARLQIVFSAVDRANPGTQAIYEADADTGTVHRVSPLDGATYSWPTWAMNATKIVYTRRVGVAGTPENIFMANADGSNPIQLTHTTWRVDQPKVSPDGRKVVFSSFWPESPQVSLMEIDLETLEVTNLSMVSGGMKPAFDSDPKWTDDGRIIFSHSLDRRGNTVPTAIWIMNADGTNVHKITNDGFFNVDAELSPNGQVAAYGSYRGPGHPSNDSSTTDVNKIKTTDWHLATINLNTHATRVLTEGQVCANFLEPCTPTQGSAAEPNWTPDGKYIGYVSVLSPTKMCVCVIKADGTGARELITSDALAIEWFNWALPGPPPATRVTDAQIGSKASSAQILYGGGSWLPGVPGFGYSGNDRFGDNGIAIPGGYQPLSAHWSSDHTKIVFSALTPYDPARFDPTPPPPPGQTRHVHFTLDELQKTWVPPEDPAPGFANEQVFLYDRTTNVVKQLTTPWTEDYMDALRPGDAHANRDPDISPDGREVVFTSLAQNGESFVLRLDLQTGSVYSLTNGTAGAVPVADAEPRFSPDGKQVAFRTSVGSDLEIWTMSAANGHIIRHLSDDGFINATPSWSPDGTEVVYTSYHGNDVTKLSRLDLKNDTNIDLRSWNIVAVDVRTGAARIVTTTANQGAFRPEFSPDGTRIGFIAVSDPGQPDIYVVPAAGGIPKPLQITFLTTESFFDWK